MSVDSFENLKAIYPNVEYVDTAFIVQCEEDGKFDVRLYDETHECSDEWFEKGRFDTWDEAQQYIEQLYDEYPHIYFNRLYELDTFVETN